MLQFSESAEAQFQDIVGRYPNTLAALLPVLTLAQSEFGWISVEVMDYVAERLDLHPAKVLSTATFYSMYFKSPPAKCNIQVCTTLSCALCGGYEIMEHLEDVLGIHVGEATGDNIFSLEEVECLASCGSAPMFQVTFSDGEIEYYENLSTKKVDGLLDELRAQAERLPDPREMHGRD